MKAFEKLGFKRGKGKRGFTLIELLIVMVILAILAGVVVMAVGGIFGQAKSRAYDTIKPQIQNGVTAYSTDHNGDLPDNVQADPDTLYTVLMEADGTPVTDCYVFDLCLIAGPGLLLRQVPDGCYDGAIDSNFANGPCVSTNPGDGHYIWVVDGAGNVYSMCDVNLNGVLDVADGDNIDGFHGRGVTYSWAPAITYTEDLWP